MWASFAGPLPPARAPDAGAVQARRHRPKRRRIDTRTLLPESWQPDRSSRLTHSSQPGGTPGGAQRCSGVGRRPSWKRCLGCGRQRAGGKGLFGKEKGGAVEMEMLDLGAELRLGQRAHVSMAPARAVGSSTSC